MTVEELLARCELVRASEKRLAECRPFSCGESDLDEFFAKDCLVNQRKLLGKTYLFCLKEQPNTIVTAFSLSNDSICLTNRITDEYKEQFLDAIALPLYTARAGVSIYGFSCVHAREVGLFFCPRRTTAAGR